MSSETRKWWMIAAVVGVLGGPYVLAEAFRDSAAPAGADVAVPVTEGEAFPVISVLDAEEQIRLIHEQSRRSLLGGAAIALNAVLVALAISLLIRKVDYGHWAWLFTQILGGFWIAFALAWLWAEGGFR